MVASYERFAGWLWIGQRHYWLPLVWVLVSLVGCGPEVSSGRVAKVWHEPAHIEQRLVPLFLGDGNIMWIPQFDNVPDRYFAEVNGRNGGRVIAMTETQFARVNRGDWWSINEGFSVEQPAAEASGERE